MNATTAVAVALAVALLSAFVTLVVWVLNKPKTDAETANQNAQSWNTLNTALSTEVARLGRVVADQGEQIKHLSEMETTLRQAYRYIRDLISWGLSGGGDNPPEPPSGLVLPEDP